MQWTQRLKLNIVIPILLFAAFMTWLLFIVSASSPFASLEPESGSLYSGATVASDSSAAGGSFVQFGSAGGGGGSTNKRGPDGKHWPSATPAYTTPATTTISNLSQLQSALNAASSGDVIEVLPHTYSSNVTLTGGNKSWAKNVLIRPPIGKRQSVIVNGNFDIAAAHVTVAGFRNNGMIKFSAGAQHSFYARIVWYGINMSHGGNDVGWYEVVRPEYIKSNTDIWRFDPNKADVDGVTLSGVWWKGAWKDPSSSAHLDTMQVYSPSYKVKNLLIEDSVIMTSTDKTFQADFIEGLTIRNTWMNSPNRKTEAPEAGEDGGYTTQAIAGNKPSAEYRNWRLYDSDILGVFNTNYIGWNEMRGSRVYNYGALKPLNSDYASVNIFDSSKGVNDWPPDPLPNLDEIWD